MVPRVAAAVLSLPLLLLLLLLTMSSPALAEQQQSAEDAEEPGGGGTAVNIFHVNPLQLTHYLRDYDTAIVFYYVNYCPVCQRLRPVFARASYLLEKQREALLSAGAVVKPKIFAAVNCVTNADGCIRTGIRRVPAFKRVRNGGRDQETLRFRYVNAVKLLDAINA